MRPVSDLTVNTLTPVLVEGDAALSVGWFVHPGGVTSGLETFVQAVGKLAGFGVMSIAQEDFVLPCWAVVVVGCHAESIQMRR